MPLIHEDIMLKKLKEELTDSLWLIFGDDSYIKEVYTGRLLDKVIDNESLKFFNFHAYEEEETPLEDIFADAEIMPVMSDKTCLLVKNYPLNTLGGNQLKEFEARLTALPSSTVLIFYYSSLNFIYNKKTDPKWFPVIDLFIKHGIAADLSHRTPQKLKSMLQKGARERNTSISDADADYLLHVAGDDVGVLLNEFNKLCAYADGAPITAGMIDETVTKTVEASVFDLSACIFAGQIDRAFEILFALLRLKTPVQPILGALASAYVNLYRLKLAKLSDRTVSDFAEKLGYQGNYDYSFRKIAPYVNEFKMDRIRTSLDILMEADVTSKSESYDPATLLTEVIAKLAAV